MMAWSLKDMLGKLCGKEVNVEKIDKNARQFLRELKSKDRKMFMRVWGKLGEFSFVEMMKGVWVE
jgi:hypothetical protein